MSKIRSIEIFENSLFEDIRIDDTNVYINIKKEKITEENNKKFDYNIHFHFCIENLINEEQLCNFFIDCDKYTNLSKKFNYLWIKKNDEPTYHLHRIDGKMSDKHPMKFSFSLYLENNSKFFIANYFPLSGKKYQFQIDKLSDTIGMNKVSIGKSIENRDIYSYEFGNVHSKPTLLFVTGFHPPESDFLAIKSIMEYLSTINHEKLLEHFSFAFIPFVNPDGIVHNLQGSNLNGINFHWKFVLKEKICSECTSLWKYCHKINPIFYLDFHSFTFWNMFSRPYYIPPNLYGNKNARKIQSEINKKLKQLCNGRYSLSEKIFDRNILSAKLRNEFGTIISPKFHLDFKEGKSKTKQLSIDVFKSIINSFEKHYIDFDEILLQPYGNYRLRIIDIIRVKVTKIYILKTRPVIGKIKRYIQSLVK